MEKHYKNILFAIIFLAITIMFNTCNSCTSNKNSKQVVKELELLNSKDNRPEAYIIKEANACRMEDSISKATIIMLKDSINVLNENKDNEFFILIKNMRNSNRIQHDKIMDLLNETKQK
jgi:hypothetical protein